MNEFKKIVEKYNLSWDMTLREANTEILSSTYVCPKCEGKGKIYIYDGFGDGRTGNYYIKCDLCKGEGRTKEQYKPVSKVIGYEKIEGDIRK